MDVLFDFFDFIWFVGNKEKTPKRHDKFRVTYSKWSACIECLTHISVFIDKSKRSLFIESTSV